MAEKIIITGAGNVAWQLSKALDKAGYTIDQVISRNIDHAKLLASQYGAYFGTQPVAGSHTDWLILCTGDDQIGLAAEQLQNHAQVLLHVSGSVDMEVLQPYNRNYGVLYPLQTLSKEREINFLTVPFLIEGNNNQTEKNILQLAEKISNKVVVTNSLQRRQMHLAAVFINNFGNHLFQLSEKIASHSGLKFELLYPLMAETVAKAISLGPDNAQTGPAKRHDQEVIALQQQWLLQYFPEMLPVYNACTESIIKGR